MSLGALLKEVTKRLLEKPVTVLYPVERTAVPSDLRGCIKYYPERCIGCLLCMRDCPAEAIKIDIVDRKKKLFKMHYYIDRCCFCAQCVDNCPSGALEITPAFELATTVKDELVKIYEPLEQAEPEA